MFLNNSVEKTNVHTVDELRHDLLLNFSEDTLFDGTDRTSFQPHVELPYPVHKPFRAVSDTVKQLLTEKSDYFTLLESKRKRHKFDKKIIVNKKIGDSEYIYLPRHLLKFYKNKDPDTYFNCDYNFYYTGGVLEHLKINNNDYLIRPDAEHNLCLNDLRNSSFVTKVFINCDCVTPIFSINSVKDDKHVLVLREKHRVSIKRLMDVETISNIWEKKYDTPVLDANLNQENPVHLGVVSSNLKLSVTDIKTNQSIFSFKNINNRTADNFQRFQFLDRNLIILVDRFVVKIIDYRAKIEENTFNPKLIDCNSICNFGILGNDILLSSRHYLMKADLRNLQGVSYYSHSLNTPPCYMDFTTRNDDTFLCLASQSQDSKILFTGNSVYSLPYKVPGIQETLKQCQLSNPSLVLIDGLDERLNYSAAGLKVINLDNTVYIYWTNCLGEMFRQRIYDEVQLETSSIDTLFDWVNNLKRPKSILYVTNVNEMSRARFSLNSTPVEKNLSRYRVESKADEFLKRFRCRYYQEHVKGNMAKDFLAVWGDDDDEEEEEEHSQYLPEVEAFDKVNSWIRRQDFSDDDFDLGSPNLPGNSQE